MNISKALRHILQLVKEKKLLLHCNHAGQPFAVLPDDPQMRAWPLRSGRVRSWISTECYRGTDLVLSPGAVETILTVAEGHAWEDVRSEMLDSELALLVEQDSLLQAVLEFMAERQVYTTMMATLQKDLTALARRNGLLGIGKRRWPGASWVLSNRLTNLSLVLQRLGIGVSIRRTNQGSEVTLKQLPPASESDAASVTASP